MSGISLAKGSSLSLAKKPNGDVRKIVKCAIGWEVIASPKELDLDISAFAAINDGVNIPVVPSDDGFIFYGQTKSPNFDDIVHSGDNRSGVGDGDDETITIDFSKVNVLRPTINEIMLVVTISEPDPNTNLPVPESMMTKHFGMLKEAYLRIFEDDGTEICKFDLDETFPSNFGIIVGSFKKVGTEWKFEATGQGVNKNLLSIAKRLNVPSAANW
jgi:tellurium resistance protein TerD